MRRYLNPKVRTVLTEIAEQFIELGYNRKLIFAATIP